MMVSETLCRLLHRGRSLKRQALGGWRCDECGVAHASTMDAGALFLGSDERTVSTSRLAALRGREEQASPMTFEAGAYVVHSGRPRRRGKVLDASSLPVLRERAITPWPDYMEPAVEAAKKRQEFVG